MNVLNSSSSNHECYVHTPNEKHNRQMLGVNKAPIGEPFFQRPTKEQYKVDTLEEEAMEEIGPILCVLEPHLIKNLFVLVNPSALLLY